MLPAWEDVDFVETAAVVLRQIENKNIVAVHSSLGSTTEELQMRHVCLQKPRPNHFVPEMDSRIADHHETGPESVLVLYWTPLLSVGILVAEFVPVGQKPSVMYRWSWNPVMVFVDTDTHGMEPVSYTHLISAFACFILASVFEIRYMISVYASQINEQGVGVLTLLRGGSAQGVAVNRVLPDEASISSSLYGRFFFTLIVSVFTLVSSLFWSKGIRTIFEYTVLFILNSYWIPQVYRNAVKGSEPRRRRHAGYQSLQNADSNSIPLLWSFIVGTSVIRLLPVVYVFTYSSNVFRHHKDVRFAVFLSLWMLFQLIVLYSQDLMGSRWFLPQHVIPDGYHYHKPVSTELMMEHGAQNNCVNCAICMSDVPVYVEEIEETHKIDIQSYMLTPCSHIFHTECLENWMSYKLQCPVCRAALPPL